MNGRHPTIHDLAQAVGKSISTVSRAINNHPRISEDTRELILKKAKELNYSPNKIASNLRSGQGNTIGAIVPRIQFNFFSGVIESIEQTLNENNYNLIICQSRESRENEKRNVQVLLDNRVAGVLVSVARDTQDIDHLKPILDRGIPLIQFDRVLPGLSTSCVVNNNESGAIKAVKHLMDEGYRRVIYLSGPTSIQLYEDRFNGYCTALEESGIEMDQRLIKPALSVHEGYEAMKSIVEEGLPFDAIFAASDQAALGAMTCLSEHDIRIPEQVGIVGYSNEPWASMINPGLTSIEQYPAEIGKTAATMILEEITYSRSYTLTYIEPELIIRRSSSRTNGFSQHG